MAYTCEISTYTEGGVLIGVGTDAKISTDQNTIIRAKFSNTDLLVPNENALIGIIRQYNSSGTTNNDLFEYPPERYTVTVLGFDITYEITITPSEANLGDVISTRLIGKDAVIPNDFLLLENGDFLLLENSDKIIL